MKFIHNINHNFCRGVLNVLAGVCMVLLAACVDGDSVVGTNTGDNEDCMYIRLSINYDGRVGSRASNPTPGQDGDGREPGIEDENHVYDVCVFIYDGGDDKVNALDDTPIIASAYATEDQLIKRNTSDGPGYLGAFSRETVPVKIPRIPVKNTTQAIVVANMGNILGEGITTLGALRDRIVAQPWKDGATPDGCTRFTMASAQESYITNVTGGSQDNPIVFECNIERTMARIDFCWLKTPRFSTEGYDTYDVVSRIDASKKLGEVYVTNMRLFNLMQKPSYFLKRVALNVGAPMVYLGRETVFGGQANNYVIEPRTISKTVANRTNTELLADWFGDTRIGLLTNEAIKTENATYPYKSRTMRFMDFRGSTVDGIIMGYTNENTLDAASSCAEYCTGILFETIYKPDVIYSYDKLTKTLTENAGPALGTTFTHYVAIDNVMDESKNLCFLNEQEAIDYRNDHPEQPADIKTYVGGRSYYRMWIKHANDGNNEVNGKMEYGIVRNNIYRIAISAFNGPGSLLPDTDTEVNLINPYIFVKPWDVIVMPEVVM